MTNKREYITCDYIKEVVEKVSGIKDLGTKVRYRYNVDCRYVYAVLCRTYSSALQHPSLEVIGSFINRDHATILHYRKRFDELYGTDMFIANNIFKESLKYLSLTIETDINNFVEEIDIKQYYKIKHLRHVEKTRSVINKLSHKLSLYRKNTFIQKAMDLSDSELEELEFKLDVFFKVKQKLREKA